MCFRLKNKPNVTLSQPPANLSAYFISFSFKTYLESGHLHCYLSSMSFYSLPWGLSSGICPELVSSWPLSHCVLTAQILTMCTDLHAFPSSPSMNSLTAFPTNLQHDLSSQALTAPLRFPSHEMFMQASTWLTPLFPSRLC